MTRSEMIAELMAKANDLKKHYTWEGYEEIWNMCNEWNFTHRHYEEIFMSDHENEETGVVDGFYIEDDYWIFE